MGNIISFDIVNGVPPFEAVLSGSTIPSQTYNNVGTYSFNNVPNGVYTLVIIDGNGCVFKKELIVNPSVTTTTTTIQPNNSIVIGNAQDQLLIFDPNATNRDTPYIGYPDPNIVDLYLWFKTLDGKPLIDIKTFSYEIRSENVTDNSLFEFIDVSDEIHYEVTETLNGPSPTIRGNIILKPGFIESYFHFIYHKGIASQLFDIEVVGSVNDIYTGINTKLDDGKNYGIITLQSDRIVIEYDDPA